MIQGQCLEHLECITLCRVLIQFMSRFSTSLYKRDDEKSMNEALQAKPDYFSSWVRFLNLGGLITSFVASSCK